MRRTGWLLCASILDSMAVDSLSSELQLADRDCIESRRIFWSRKRPLLKSGQTTPESGGYNTDELKNIVGQYERCETLRVRFSRDGTKFGIYISRFV